MTELAEAGDARRQALFDQALAQYSSALQRLTHAYERMGDKRDDLLQEIYLALWQSLRSYDGRCALGTWVYRVAHNTATSICVRRRDHLQLVALDEIAPAAAADIPRAIDEGRARERLLTLIHRLKPVDRQVVLLYLEDLDAAAIGDVVGLSASNVSTKIHRLKKVLAQQFHERNRS
jgi:RNA polymerase sigma-70 factor (ECF subfamily)